MCISAQLIASLNHGANGANAVQNVMVAFKSACGRSGGPRKMEECHASRPRRHVHAMVKLVRRIACSANGPSGPVAQKIAKEARRSVSGTWNIGLSAKVNAQMHGPRSAWNTKNAISKHVLRQ